MPHTYSSDHKSESKKVLTKILFICMGNICRSPCAEAVMQSLVKQQGMEKEIDCDSAGTIDYTNGVVNINAVKITAVSNVDGATSTQIRVTAIPSSSDVVPVRNQILEIDLVNSTITGQIDNTATTGVGYTTTTSGTASTTSVNTTTSYPTSSGY